MGSHGKKAAAVEPMRHQVDAGSPTTRSVALVVGVTGMVGVSLAEALKNPTAPGGPWEVYGASRRPLPSWFPASALDGYVQVDALLPGDAREKLSPLAGRVTHLFWVALQTLETEAANIAANTAMLANVLDALATPPGSRLRHVSLQTGTKHYMGPISDPAFWRSFTRPLEPPFREDYPRLPFPCFYYDQEDLLASRSVRGGFTWSVHRASIIFGASSRSAYNFLLTVSIYAAICRREGAPFRFPGTAYAWGHFCDASDAGVLAEQQIWAATTEAAQNQALNCTNGDVFTWEALWRALAEALGVEFVGFSPADEEEEADWAERMRGKGPVWDAIVEAEGLRRTRLEEVTCFEAAHMVIRFGFQHVSSMNKSRELGFHGCVDTLKSVGRWVQKYREMNIIPLGRHTD